MVGPEAQYLIDTIGEVIAQGCSAVAAVKPSDPVEYLGLWLLQYVKNVEIEGDVLKERSNAVRLERIEKEKAAKTCMDKQERMDRRRAALDELSRAFESNCVRTPMEAWKLGTKLVTEFTAATSAYVAAVLSDEDPPVALEEEDVETDDEQDRIISSAEPLQGEEDPGNNAIQAEASREVNKEAEEIKQVPSELRFDYSKKFLQYVVGSESQQFIESGNYELRRPIDPTEEGADEGLPSVNVPCPPTFRILDEKMPSLYIPACMMDKSLHFLKKIPKAGSYFACALRSELGEYKAILGCDTLIPPGSAEGIGADDRDFIWRVAQSIGRLTDSLEAQHLKRGSAKDEIEQLRTEIGKFYSPLPSREEAADVQSSAKEEDGDQAETAAVAPDESQDSIESEDIKALKEVIRNLKRECQEAEASCNAAELDLATEVQILDLIKAKISAFADPAVKALQCFIAPPRATYMVLKAILYMIGRQGSSLTNWRACRKCVSPDLFRDILKFDATFPRDVEVWRRIRQSYKSVADPWALENELPDTCMGVLLLMMVKQSRRISRRSVKKQEAEQFLLEKQQEMSKSENDLHVKIEENTKGVEATQETQEPEPTDETGAT